MSVAANTGKKSYQYPAGILAVIVVSGICYPFSELIGCRVVALVLLITVSLVAMLFDILPVLVAAMRDALLQLAQQGMTLLVAEQNQILAAHAHRVLQLAGGRLA